MSGLGQADLAKKIGISQGYLSKIEGGRIDPSAIDWYNLASSLEICSDSFIWGYPEFIGKLDSIDNLARRVKFPQKCVDTHPRIKLRFLYPILAYLENTMGREVFKKKIHKLLESLDVNTVSLRLPELWVNEFFINTVFAHFGSGKEIEKILTSEIDFKSDYEVSWSKDIHCFHEIQSPIVKIQKMLVHLSGELVGLNWFVKCDKTQNISEVDLWFTSSFKNLGINELLLPLTANRLLPMIHESTGDKRAHISELSNQKCQIVWKKIR